MGIPYAMKKPIMAPSKLNTIETLMSKRAVPNEAITNTIVSMKNTFLFLIGLSKKSKSSFLVKKCRIGMTETFWISTPSWTIFPAM